MCGRVAQVDMSKNQINAASWVIKKSINLHGRLQTRSKTRRDEDVQELTVARPKFGTHYLTTCAHVYLHLKGFCFAHKDLFDAILDGRLTVERPSEHALDKANHGVAPVRKRLRLHRKQSASSSESPVELSPSVAGCDPFPADQGTEQANGSGNEQLDSATGETSLAEGGEPVIEVPDSLLPDGGEMEPIEDDKVRDPMEPPTVMEILDTPARPSTTKVDVWGPPMQPPTVMEILDTPARPSATKMNVWGPPMEPPTVIEILDTPARPGATKMNVWGPLEQADQFDGVETPTSETPSVLECLAWNTVQQQTVFCICICQVGRVTSPLSWRS